MEAQRSYEELINNDAINSAKSGMQFAVDKQPDTEARLQTLAKQYNLPVDAVRLDPKAIERKSQLDAVDYESLVKTAPHTNYLLSDPNKAAVAHDDIPNLSQIEGGLKALRSPELNALNIASGLLSNLSFSPLHSAIKVAFHDAFFDDGTATAQLRHNDLLRKSLQQKDALDNTTPDFETDTARGIYSGAASFMQALPGMAASVATANPLPMIASAGVQQGFPAYGKYLYRGATKAEAALGAVGEGTAEMGFEALPMGFIVKKFGKVGAGEFLTGLFAREIPSEQATTIAQDAIDTAIANPDKSWGDFVNERPDAAYQTLLATVTQGGITGAISSIAKRMTDQGKHVDSANLGAINIEKLNQLAAASKVLARSPDTIKTFAEAALAGSPVQDLYIDAETFLQSGVAEHVAALLPDVAEQLKEALPGTEIRIPISDYLTHIAATDYAATLKDHLRLEGDDYSPAQAQSYMQTHAQEMQHEIDSILTSHQQADTFRTSQDTVKATVLEQLNKLNRFSSTKNELDATLISARMAVRAAQLGITPEQMHEKQTPNFAAESVGGGMVYGQTEKTAETVTARWQKALSRIKDPNFEPNFDTPLAIKHMGVVEKFLPFPVKVMKQVLSKHKDLPVGVVANLPTLLADPLFIFPHKDGGIRVVINAKTDKGEPIVVGIGNGRIKTITPIHHGEDINGTERLNNQFRSALQAGEKVYARNKNALTEAKAFDLAPVGHNYQGRYNKSKKRITTNEDLVKKYGDSFYQQQYGSFHPPTNTIAIFKQGNLSTVLHELGHFFFENDIALAAELFTKPEFTAGEQQIVSDVSALLNWSGIQGTLQEQLDQWYSMDIEEKRGAHERTAEAFEAYLFSGTAPSIELQHAFQTFRTWLISVYKSLKDFLASHPEAGKLNEEVSAIFDRMLATEEEIKLAEKARSLMPLFESAQKAGMSEADFAAYQALGVEATNTAIDALQAKALGDMEWMGRAHTQYLKALQKKHDELRREVRSQARTDIMAQPVYRAYSFLTGKLSKDDKIAQPTTAKSNPKHVDPSIDSLFVAIAKLGGLQRGQLTEEWNYDHQGRVQMPVFGKPVVRKNGGLSIETMAESLMDEGYLNMDEHGKYDLHEFEEKFSAELRGVSQYAHGLDVGNIMHEDHKAGEAVINPDGLGAGRFELSELRGMGLPEAVLNLMINLKMTAKDGLHPDIVSDLFGFSSGDELVNALASAENPKAAIEHLTDQRMLQEHGELATPEAVEEAANRAVHNKFRERLLRSEANALAKATGSLRLLGNAAKEYTQAMISRLKVRDIKPINYSRAEVKAARAAEQAHRKGDTEQAAIEKRNQVLNMQAFRAAVAAQEEIDAGLRKVKQLNASAAQGNMRGDFLAQLNTLLARFDFRTSLSLKEIDQHKAPLADWIISESERLDAVVPELPDFMLNENIRKHYKDFTVDEFRAFMAGIKQLEFMARREQKQYMEIRQQNFEQERDAVLAVLKENYPEAFDAEGQVLRLEPDFVPTLSKTLSSMADGFIGEFLNAENIIDLLERGKMGQVFDSLFGRISHRSDWKAERLTGIYQTLKPLFKAYGLKEGRDFSRKGIPIDAIKTSITRENAVMVALLNGNAEGKDRLSNYGWNEYAVNAITSQLTPKDIDLIEGIWALFDHSLWPELKELNERTRGQAPPKVEAVPYMINGRQVTGGYMRLKYDTKLDERSKRLDEGQAVKDLLGGGLGMTSKTNQGTSNQRVQDVKLRPRLDLGVMSEAIVETVHDIAYREAIADTMRMLNDRAIGNAVKLAQGTPAYDALVTRVREVAAPPRNPAGWIEKPMSVARKNTVIAMMSGVTTALQNFTGIAPAIGKSLFTFETRGLMLREITRFYSPKMNERIQFALESSAYMRGRFGNFDRDLSDMTRQLAVNGSIMPSDATFLWLMSAVDRAVAVPIWCASFGEGMQKFNNDSDQATDYADRFVRQTQGSGRDVDLSQIMAGHGAWGQLKKVFTMFYSYFNAQLGLLVTVGAVSKQEAKTNPSLAAAKFTAQFIAIVVVPTVLTELLMHGPGDDDEPEEMARHWAKVFLRYGGSFFPLARDVLATSLSIYAPDGRYVSGFRLSPIESAVETAIKVPAALVDIFSGEGKDSDTRTAIMGISVMARLPGKLISDTVRGTKAWLAGDAGPQAVILGPPKKH